MVQGFHPFVRLDVALHRFPERRALPPAALGADDKVQAGWMRSVGPALNVDVLCGQEVECGAYARGRRGHAGAGDDPGGVDVFLEPWRGVQRPHQVGQQEGRNQPALAVLAGHTQTGFADSRPQGVNKEPPLPLRYLERLAAEWAGWNHQPAFGPVRNHVAQGAIRVGLGFPGLEQQLVILSLFRLALAVNQLPNGLIFVGHG